MWMNEFEIDNAQDIFSKRAPKLYPFARFLSDWRHIVNANSDGWPYWRAGAQCAEKLSDAILSAEKAMRESRELPAESAFLKALTPIRTFATKHKLTVPTLWTQPTATDTEATTAKLQHVCAELSELIDKANDAENAFGYRADMRLGNALRGALKLLQEWDS